MINADRPTVLYVDDEANNLLSFKASFRRHFDVLTAESAEEALAILGQHEVHVIVSDQRMPQTTGIEFFASIVEAYPDPIRILLTGYADIQAVIDAINLGQVYRYFSKPWNEKEILQQVTLAFELYKARVENRTLTQRLMDTNDKMEFLLRQKLLS